MKTARLEELSLERCLGLLRQHHLGRIAVVVDGQPLIFPVNYAIAGRTIVVRTDPGTKLHAAVGRRVAFQIDSADAVYHDGWSVLVTGVAQEECDALRLREFEALPIRPWGPGPKSHWLTLRGGAITGRRIVHEASSHEGGVMTEQLNVLVLESDRAAADIARDELTAAGHRVVRCHEPGHRAFPCNALATGQTCPLAASPVDVALDVRLHARTQPTPWEDGVRCVIQQHVPLVVAGPNVLNPFADYATATLERDEDIVDAVERAAHAPLWRQSDAGARAVRDVLDRRENRATARVTVRRRHGSLLVDVAGLAAADQTVKDVTAVRIVAAIREIDAFARGIDVRFVE